MAEINAQVSYDTDTQTVRIKAQGDGGDVTLVEFPARVTLAQANELVPPDV